MDEEKAVRLGHLIVGGDRAHAHPVTDVRSDFWLSNMDGGQVVGTLRFTADRTDRNVLVHLLPKGVEEMLDGLIGQMPLGHVMKNPRLKQLCQMILAGFEAKEQRHG